MTGIWPSYPRLDESAHVSVDAAAEVYICIDILQCNIQDANIRQCNAILFTTHQNSCNPRHKNPCRDLCIALRRGVGHTSIAFVCTTVVLPRTWWVHGGFFDPTKILARPSPPVRTSPQLHFEFVLQRSILGTNLKQEPEGRNGRSRENWSAISSTPCNGWPSGQLCSIWLLCLFGAAPEFSFLAADRGSTARGIPAN